MESLLAAHDIALVRAANPGPLTLSGTNTWLVGRDPCWVVDPGPALTEHVDAVLAAASARGGIGGVALTHDHGDHADAAAGVAARAGGVPVAAVRWPGADVRIEPGARVGPLEAIPVTGHAPDHVCFAVGAACLTGDAVLGEGSVFIAPDPGALRGYLDGLRRLRAREFAVLLPGHGPPIADAAAKLDGYVAHRLEREARLVAALAGGARSVDALLDGAWADVPAPMRPVAAITLAAHLDKLEEEGRLPDGVQRPSWG
ncbi:MAG TPA: MBL fold metallo-hydrolase [Baekduia sp.]|nr:MBL fold metallo-hydrolase [Baekduia sp.]